MSRMQPAKKALVLDIANPNIKHFKECLEEESLAFVHSMNDANTQSIISEIGHSIAMIIVELDSYGENKSEIFKQIKTIDEKLHISVIILTSEVNDNLLLQSSSIGNHHILQKPYRANVFESFIKRALKDHERYIHYTDKKNKHHIHKLMKKGVFEFNDFYGAHDIADWFASGCERDGIVVGFIELLINSVEHGNLGIGYEMKTELLDKGKYMDFIIHRLEEPPYNKMKVIVEFEIQDDGYLFVSIKDSGSGFDFENYLNADPIRLLDKHGRGVIMASKLYFDELKYVGNGSEVHVKAKLK
jgi:hypothetical protein